MSSSGTSRKEELIAELNRAIFMRESLQAARAYEDALRVDPDLMLDGHFQFDLARLLELGNEPRLALQAYESIIDVGDEHESYKVSLRGAGHISYRVKDYKKCRSYLEDFLASNPSANDAQDARGILQRLPDGKGVPDAKTLERRKSPPPATEPEGSSVNLFADAAEQHRDINSLPTESDYGALISTDHNFKDGSGGSAVDLGSGLYLSDDEEKPAKAEEDEALAIDFGHADNDATMAAPKLNEAPSRASNAFEAPKVDDDFFNPPLAFDSHLPGVTEPIKTERKAPEPVKSSLPRKDEPLSADQISDDFFGPPLGLEHPGGLPEEYAEDSENLKGHFDMYEDTPPLSIGSRDVIKKFPMPGQRDDLPGGTTGWARDKHRQPIEKYQQDPTPATIGRTDRPNERFRSLEFAMLLAQGGVKISMDQVVEVVKATEKLSEGEARKAIIERKGILREGLSYDDLIEMYPHLRKVRQNFLFVAMDPSLCPDPCHDVHKFDVLDPGLRMHTNRGVKKAKWEHIRLISCGRIDREPTVDLFCKEPTMLFRLREGTIDWVAAMGDKHADANEAARAFLEKLTKKCPGAVVTRTVTNFLKDKDPRPQKFPSDDEFHRYNLCLLWANFGEAVNVKDLYEADENASASASAW